MGLFIGTIVDDSLVGTSDDDTLIAGTGNDTLSAGLGNDSLAGNTGTDTVNFDTSLGAINVSLRTGRATGAGNDTLTGIENITTLAYNDTIEGDANANSLDGGAGTDMVRYSGATAAVSVSLRTGRATGGDGDDTLIGFEYVTGSAYSDTIEGDSGANSLDGGAGADTLSYAGATAAVSVFLSTGNATGGDVNDSLTGFEHITGSAYNDTLEGAVGNNSLDGGAGADSLMGDYSDTLSGGAGDDSLYVDHYYRCTVLGGDGNDTFFSPINFTWMTSEFPTIGVSVLEGGAGDDSFSVNGYNNTLDGGAGNDTFSIVWSYDGRLDGGAGTDLLTYSDSGIVPVDVSLRTGLVIEGGSLNTLIGIENVTGSIYNDTIGGDSGANSLAGGSGTDMLTYVGASAGVVANITTGRATGGDGNDSLEGFENLTGSDYGDRLTGDGGANTLLGRGGNDSLNGGGGSDSLDGGVADDSLGGGDGTDTLLGGAGNDSLNGGAGDDSLSGGDGSDMAAFAGASAGVVADLATGRATGGAGNDTLVGFENLSGSGYGDSLTGDGNANTLLGGAGNDSLDSGAGNDTLNGGAGTDCLLGGEGNDRLTLGGGNSLAFGGAGADVLIAGTGNAVLAGGLANDTVITAAGANVILFNAGDGVDIVSSSDTDRDDTLSLGGGITRGQLTLSKNGANLVLKAGASDAITFANWYAATNARTSVLNLQLIEAAAGDFNAGSADPLLSSKVLRFDFAAIVADFDAARGGAATYANWSMAASMAAHLTGGSDTAAIGGDLAYQYGMTDGLSAVGSTGATNVLSGAGFATSAQTLQTDAALGAGSLKLR